MAGIDRADGILLVGADPRTECAVLNARLRRAWLNGARIGSVGPSTDGTFPVESLGRGPEDLHGLLETRFGQMLREARHPLVILGQGALARPDGGAVLGRTMALAEQAGAVRDDWCGFSVLHTAAGVVGGLEIGFLPGEGGLRAPELLDAARAGDLDVLFLLGADEADLSALEGQRAFVVYLGSHGDAGAAVADAVLPGAAWTEQSGIFVNMEGRPQFAARAVDPPGEAREDWRILRALSGALGRPLPYDTLSALRADLFDSRPSLAGIGEITPAPWEPVSAGEVDVAPFEPVIGRFYETNPVARASAVLADISARRGGTLAAAA